MTLTDCEKELLKLDPHGLVHAGMDGFSAYTYIDLPDDLQVHVDALSADDSDKFNDFVADYLARLESHGVTETKQYLSINLD